MEAVCSDSGRLLRQQVRRHRLRYVAVINHLYLYLYLYLNRKIVRRMLESSANRAVLGDCTTILEADDGTTALEVLRSESAAGRVVDFVLLDYVMVRMNGPEAARRMRAELGYRGVVIGITGNALPEDLAAFRDHGATVVLTKPLTNAKLMDAIYQSSLDRTVHMV